MWRLWKRPERGRCRLRWKSVGHGEWGSDTFACFNKRLRASEIAVKIGMKTDGVVKLQPFDGAERMRRIQHERDSCDERRRMVSAGVGWNRSESCLLCRVDAAPHPVALARARGAADPRPLGEGCGLYG